MIYNYIYNYRTLYIDVSRETIKIIYIRIYRRVYIYIITEQSYIRYITYI